ncbi:MAG: hypothetical protein VKO64_01880 [Candidatus Sericytochromatia bacterium]|nr:hypothetical protein [Candidatus Sericytochromatia bacterium]
MTTFLVWIGWYNVLGSLVLFALLHPNMAHALLHAWTRILSQPWSPGPLGRLWLSWAAACNLALGFLMVRAAAWPDALQRDVVLATMGVYVVMYGVLLAGGRQPLFGPGLAVVHVLWLAQLGWGLWLLMA